MHVIAAKAVALKIAAGEEFVSARNGPWKAPGSSPRGLMAPDVSRPAYPF